jgi:oligopeptidase A
LEELKDFAKRTDAIDDLAGYDVAYYSEKLKKEKFDFDDTMTKPYFEQETVLRGMLDIVSELFSVTFKAADVPIWNDCVKAFDIYEEGELSGRIYFDLDARKEKRGGAWMNDWETHYIDAGGKKHLPSAFVVCNFSPATEKTPSLLRHDDVVTLFHEMGHAIHHLFGRSNERSVSGINGVSWDVVEFPSQFLENFAYEASILKRFAFHYETKDPISDTLLAKIKETKNFQAALGILRQVEFSLFDFQLHQKLYQGEEVQTLIDGIREKTSLLRSPDYNKFQHGFAHIFAGGYAAGYYSYKWAEVLSADAFFSCLDENEGFDKEQAKGYKEYILANGGSKEMSDLYQEWLGRKADVKSLIKLYEIE